MQKQLLLTSKSIEVNSFASKIKKGSLHPFLEGYLGLRLTKLIIFFFFFAPQERQEKKWPHHCSSVLGLSTELKNYCWQQNITNTRRRCLTPHLPSPLRFNAPWVQGISNIELMVLNYLIGTMAIFFFFVGQCKMFRL